ncbi:MAG TPA: hypothetical protein VGL57_11540 [Solirubrobacteraceae bacterium]|jgi:hypothetical protein
MKKIRTLGLALVAVLAFAGISATGAIAYEWQQNGSALTKATAVTGESTLTLETIVGSRYSCAILRKGTVGPGAAGEFTSITSPSGAKAIPCTITHSGTECESQVEIEAVGLPWHTEITTESRNLLTASHEWKITCKDSAHEVTTNWCLLPRSTALVNVSGGVEQAYDSISEHTSCFYGSHFVMTGSELLKTSSGTLSIGTSATKVPWLLSGVGLSKSIATPWKGKLSVVDSKDLGIECEDTAEATAGLYGGGTITKLTMSNCKSVHFCENSKPMSIEALHLPWNTEMVSEGSAQDKIVGAGNGTPAFSLSCAALGVIETEVCTGALRAEATNGVGGVNAVFDDPEKLKCELVGSGGKLEATLSGTQSITASGGTLEV